MTREQTFEKSKLINSQNCLDLQHNVTHATNCNTMQYTATHCNTRQYTATHLIGNCLDLQHNVKHATDCNTLQYTATHCNTRQYTATHLIDGEIRLDRLRNFQSIEQIADSLLNRRFGCRGRSWHLYIFVYINMCVNIYKYTCDKRPISVYNL